ncbi:hypothetical protein HYX14_06240 [Candidatus Woesearchaeota archaeon]|nr:hypothetical protein [Candidatus Woesearchaeota archaeon]
MPQKLPVSQGINVSYYTMKKKLSVSIEEDILKRMESKLQDRVFRNKSHIVELALSRLFQESEDHE